MKNELKIQKLYNKEDPSLLIEEYNTNWKTLESIKALDRLAERVLTGVLCLWAFGVGYAAGTFVHLYFM